MKVMLAEDLLSTFKTEVGKNSRRIADFHSAQGNVETSIAVTSAAEATTHSL